MLHRSNETFVITKSTLFRTDASNSLVSSHCVAARQYLPSDATKLKSLSPRNVALTDVALRAVIPLLSFIRLYSLNNFRVFFCANLWIVVRTVNSIYEMIKKILDNSDFKYLKTKISLKKLRYLNCSAVPLGVPKRLTLPYDLC